MSARALYLYLYPPQVRAAAPRASTSEALRPTDPDPLRRVAQNGPKADFLYGLLPSGVPLPPGFTASGTMTWDAAHVTVTPTTATTLSPDTWYPGTVTAVNGAVYTGDAVYPIKTTPGRLLPGGWPEGVCLRAVGSWGTGSRTRMSVPRVLRARQSRARYTTLAPPPRTTCAGLQALSDTCTTAARAEPWHHPPTPPASLPLKCAVAAAERGAWRGGSPGEGA